ncbi:MAG: serine protease, partial [Methylocella sp.]
MPDQPWPRPDRLTRRLVEVFSEKWPNDPTASFGSGFLLGDGLVLTARHVLMPKNWWAQVPENLVLSARPLALAKKSPLMPAVVLWPPTVAELASDDTPDVALIRIAEVPGFRTGPFSLGLGEGEELGAVNVFAAGFPNWRAKGNIREVGQITGRIPTLSGARAGRYEVTALKMEGGRDLDDKLDWRGMSGAALCYGKHIIGVLVLHEEDGRIDFLAVRLDDLLERPDFASALPPVLAGKSARDLKSAYKDLSSAEMPPSDGWSLDRGAATKRPSAKGPEVASMLQPVHLPSRIASRLGA